LPRYIDKIRLHLAGRLHADYQPNLGKAFDERWCKARGSHTSRWSRWSGRPSPTGRSRTGCSRTSSEAKPTSEPLPPACWIIRPPGIRPESTPQDAQGTGRLGHRDDVRTFVDFIDADEKRL
ncbi:MAG: DUF5069 domain-containing protein, partial [Rhodobacteraceae bacterium]|nr:DUF5069 domain-containing protein [Paracoccaceae bacterium]